MQNRGEHPGIDIHDSRGPLLRGTKNRNPGHECRRSIRSEPAGQNGRIRVDLAEREGFEPPSRFPVNLISSQAPSTGLGHLSARRVSFFLSRNSPKKSLNTAPHFSASTSPVTGIL